MELIEVGFGAAMTIVGGAVSWAASWYYYFKSKPQQTAVDALVRAAQSTQRTQSSHSIDIPLEVALEIIQAFEQHKLYYPELTICARTYRIVGDLLKKTLAAVEAAGVSAGPTLSHAWIAARDRALKEGLAKAKEDIQKQLGKKEELE
jgi:hypothetical protein